MAEILEIDSQRPQPDRIARAAALLQQGDVVGIPTDTVYGLASDAFNAAAAEKVFALKQRAATMPLLILVNSLDMARACMLGPSRLFDKLAERFWPGPLTIVVPATTRIPRQVTAGSGTIGIRLPNSAIAQALVAASRVPVTASSANLSGHPESRSAADVKAAFGEGLPLILDGGVCLSTATSTVVSIADGFVQVLREGRLPAKAISEFLAS